MQTVNYLYRHVMIGSIAVAFVCLLSLHGTAWAQQKGAEECKKIQTAEDLQSLDLGDKIVMICPKCHEVSSTTVEKTFKTIDPGKLHATTIHICSGCDTKIVTDGHGKQAKEMLVNTCMICGRDVTCYVAKKTGGPVLAIGGAKK